MFKTNQNRFIINFKLIKKNETGVSMKILQILYIGIVLGLSITCKSEKLKMQESHLELIADISAELSDQEILSIKKTNKQNILGWSLSSKGETWKLWETLHHECMNSKIFNNPFYFGTSNKTGIGAIWKNDISLLYNEMEFNKDEFSDSELSKVIIRGNPVTCNYTKKTNLSISNIIGADLSAGANIELNNAISTSKSLDATVEGMQIDELAYDRLLKLLKSDAAKKTSYIDSFLRSDAILVVRAAKVNAFSARLMLTKKISAALEAELKKGIVQELNSGSLKIKLEYDSETSIKIITQSPFYVFVKFNKSVRK
jgi:hypothetical protein